MKRSISLVLAGIAVCGMAGSSAQGAGSARENKRLQEGKITKNQAEHFVLAKYPGAKITKCELKHGKDHSVWVVDIVKPGARDPMQVQVDGRTGKILP